MVVVETKQELKAAIKNKEQHIRVKEPLSDEINKTLVEKNAGTAALVSGPLILALLGIITGSFLISKAINKDYSIKVHTNYVDLEFNS